MANTGLEHMSDDELFESIRKHRVEICNRMKNSIESRVSLVAKDWKNLEYVLPEHRTVEIVESALKQSPKAARYLTTKDLCYPELANIFTRACEGSLMLGWNNKSWQMIKYLPFDCMSVMITDVARKIEQNFYDKDAWDCANEAAYEYVECHDVILTEYHNGRVDEQSFRASLLKKVASHAN